MSEPSDEQAWLPFDDFLASGASGPKASGHTTPDGPSALTGGTGAPGPVSATGAPGPVGATGALTGATGAPGPVSATERAMPRILLVGELTRHIKDALRDSPRLRDLWVEGEVGQVSVSSAGHCYFTLKDERAQVRCMIFRDDRMAIPFQPRTGVRLVAHGRVDVFEAQGVYQLYVDTLQPAGFGDLALRFEALKAQLTKEGLFDSSRKRPLPQWPRTIGICTSLSGAVLHDMRKVLARRWPSVRVLVSACQVQGPGAPESIVDALRRMARWTDSATGRAADVVILARGGGSMEDLWAFNEEAVVRAVAAFPVPIVVGVGHETDVTLAEFAADVRAATPSVAAELCVPSRVELDTRLGTLQHRLAAATTRSLSAARGELDAERRALDAFRPSAYLAAERERAGLLLDRATRAVTARLEVDAGKLQRLDDRLPLVLQGRLARARTDLARSAATLTALSPFGTLERGYALVRDAAGDIVRDSGTVTPGDALDVRLARGALDVRVERVPDSAS